MCFILVRKLAATSSDRFTPSDISKLKIHICSRNNFPTAAGLASSASGFACLGYYKPHLPSVTPTIILFIFFCSVYVSKSIRFEELWPFRDSQVRTYKLIYIIIVLVLLLFIDKVLVVRVEVFMVGL